MKIISSCFIETNIKNKNKCAPQGSSLIRFDEPKTFFLNKRFKIQLKYNLI